MGLKNYLVARDGRFHRRGEELARLAASCKVTPYYLYMLAAGHKVASPELAANLEYATRGIVNRRTTLPAFPWDGPTEKAA